jgi:hypothetical protein
MPTAHPTEILYRINARDELVSVGGAWTAFALENDGGDLAGDRVVGCSLWGFIDDESTRRLYRQLLKIVRHGNPMTFPLRCDCPGQRRHLEMTLSPCPGDAGEVLFRSRLVSLEERAATPLLARHTLRSGELIRCCAWCNRFVLGASEWVELEEAIDRLQLFAKTKLPGISHGICPNCFEVMKRRVDAMNVVAP